MLKYYRMKKGYSQEKLARAVDVSLRTIQNIERKNNTDVKTAIKISKVLEVTIEELFKEE